ncbi:MAG: hypothetical protein JSS65_14605 [Armatimonadetes bacterium]|nr:hypothetical protein [Armatimonadota bacterium]
MYEQRLDSAAQETVTDEEVRALVERFGERQAMGKTQTTVLDVAEAMQVEPSTVRQMLDEMRRSKDQDEIKSRLDRLERENAELRARAANMETGLGWGTGLDDWQGTKMDQRSTLRMLAMVCAISVAMIMMVVAKKGGGASPAILFAVIPAVMIAVIAKRRNSCHWK